MKIVHVIVGLDRGGAEAMLRNLVLFSKANKHVVVSLTTKGALGDELERNGVAVFPLGGGSFLSLPLIFLRLVRIFRAESPDVVQTWMVHSDFIGGMAARVSGVPHVVWGVRTTDYSIEGRSARVLRWLCARLSPLIPSRIVSAARASAAASVEAGYCAEKIVVIPNGFDIAALEKNKGQGRLIRRRVGIKENELVIGCMGRYNPAKDHLNFIKAAGIVAAKCPTARYLMVGRGLVDSNRELIAHIEQTGFPERFFLLGERSDSFSCLDAMNIFVLSSCTEGFPNVLGEAMIMGVPCVSTDVGDAAFILGNAGELVPPRDSSALAAAVERLIEMSPSERLMVGQRGRDRVAHEFSIAQGVRKFDELYLALAGNR